MSSISSAISSTVPSLLCHLIRPPKAAHRFFTPELLDARELARRFEWLVLLTRGITPKVVRVGIEKNLRERKVGMALVLARGHEVEIPVSRLHAGVPRLRNPLE